MKVIDNTEMFYYLTKRGETMSLGMMDLQHHQLLYNIELNQQVDFVSFLNHTYVNQSPDYNKQFLAYSISNKIYKVCPFVHSGNYCTFHTNYFIINNQNNNQAPMSCPDKVLLGRYCVDKCPIGYEKKGTVCTLCSMTSLTNWYYFIQEKCVSSCDESSYIAGSNYICFDCTSNDKIYYKESCVDKCSDVYAEYIKENNTCRNCLENGLFYYNETCRTECPQGSEIVSETGNCLFCKDYYKYYSNGKCVDECEVNELFDENNVCYNCSKYEKTPFKEGNECVETCKFGSETDFERYMCIDCKSIGKYYHKDKKICIDSCPKGYVSDNDKICYSCQSVGQFFQDDKCQDECDLGYGPTIDAICYSCLEKDEYYFQNNCWKECPDYSVFDEKHICSFCEDKQYYQNNTCVNECKKPFAPIIDQDIRYCKYCKAFELFYYQNKCVEKCGEYMAYDEDNVCINCSDQNKKFFNHTCVDNCPRACEIDTINSWCIYCKDKDWFFEKFRCLEKCEDYFVVDTSDNYCYSCSEVIGKPYYENGKCVGECIEGSQVDTEKKVCVICKLIDQYYFKGDCSEQCPNWTYADQENYCYSCYCSERGKCNNSTGWCDCEEGFEGDHCEIERSNNPHVKIVNLNTKIIRSDWTKLSYKILNEELLNSTYSVKWSLIVGVNNWINDTNTQTGRNDDIFVLNSFSLDNRNTSVGDYPLFNKNNNTVLLEITNKKTMEKYSDYLTIRLQSFTEATNRFFMTGSYNYSISCTPMKTWTTWKIKDWDSNNEMLLFKVIIRDKYNELLPLSFATKKNTFSSVIPYSTVCYFIIINDRGEQIKKSFYPAINISSNDETVSQIWGNNSTETYKIFAWSNYLSFSKKQWTLPEFEEIMNFVKSRFKEVVLNKKYIEQSETKDGNNNDLLIYAEPKTVFSWINHWVLFLKHNENQIKTVLDFLTEISWEFNTTVQLLSKDDILSFVRTVDSIIESSSSFIADNKVNIIITFQNVISYWNKRSYPGGALKLIGKRFKILIEHLGREQELVSFPNVHYIQNDSLYNSYVFENYLIQKECKLGKTLWCIDVNTFRNINEEIKLLSEDTKQINLVVYLLEINIEDKGGDVSSPSKTLLNIYNVKDDKTYNAIDSLNYHISFPISTQMLLRQGRRLSGVTDDSINYTNITCYSTSNIDNYCATHFDYSNQEIVCNCSETNTLIYYVNNATLANWHKTIQFPELQSKQLNLLIIPVIYTSIIFIIIPSIWLVIYDIHQDNLLLYEKKQISQSEQRIQYYNQWKFLHNSNTFSFAWYITLLKSPIINIFLTYNYMIPHYIVYLLSFISLLLSFIISSLPYYIVTDFKRKNIFKNRRDIWYSDSVIHNIPINIIDVFTCMIIAMLSSFIVWLWFMVLEKLFHWTEKFVNTIYWKNILTMFKDFVYNDIKKDVWLNENFNSIKNRMLAYHAICGKYTLEKKQQNKFMKYLLYKAALKNKKDISNMNLESMEKFKDEIIMDNKRLVYNENQVEQREIISNSLIRNSNNSLVSIDNDVDIIQAETQINFTLNKNNKTVLPYKTIQKFVNIKTKYILQTKSQDFNETDIDMSSLNNHPIYEIETNESYTYIANPHADSSELGKSNKNILRLGIVTIVLFLIIAVLYYFFIVILSQLYNRYELFIIKCWLIPSLVELLLINFLLQYGLNVVISYIMFNIKRGNILWRLVDKYVIWIYKIRNLISKYNNEFSYED